MVAEANGWSVFIAGTPVAAEGATLDQAIHEVVKALRKYAADWIDHLSTAPNQSGNWGSSAGSRVGRPVRDASVRTKATCRCVAEQPDKHDLRISMIGLTQPAVRTARSVQSEVGFGPCLPGRGMGPMRSSYSFSLTLRARMSSKTVAGGIFTRDTTRHGVTCVFPAAPATC